MRNVYICLSLHVSFHSFECKPLQPRIMSAFVCPKKMFQHFTYTHNGTNGHACIAVFCLFIIPFFFPPHLQPFVSYRADQNKSVPDTKVLPPGKPICGSVFLKHQITTKVISGYIFATHIMTVEVLLLIL